MAQIVQPQRVANAGTLPRGQNSRRAHGAGQKIKITAAEAKALREQGVVEC